MTVGELGSEVLLGKGEDKEMKGQTWNMFLLNVLLVPPKGTSRQQISGCKSLLLLPVLCGVSPCIENGWGRTHIVVLLICLSGIEAPQQLACPWPSIMHACRRVFSECSVSCKRTWRR